MMMFAILGGIAVFVVAFFLGRITPRRFRAFHIACLLLPNALAISVTGTPARYIFIASVRSNII